MINWCWCRAQLRQERLAICKLYGCRRWDGEPMSEPTSLPNAVQVPPRIPDGANAHRADLFTKIETLQGHLRECALLWGKAAKEWKISEAEEISALENANQCRRWAGEKVK